MNGYPKYVATVSDYQNLLQVPEFRSRVLAELTIIRDADDATVQRVINISNDGNEETETIENPMPLWKIKGFISRAEVADMIAANEEVKHD